jgi:hypothetical protein
MVDPLCYKQPNIPMLLPDVADFDPTTLNQVVPTTLLNYTEKEARQLRPIAAKWCTVFSWDAQDNYGVSCYWGNSTSTVVDTASRVLVNLHGYTFPSAPRSDYSRDPNVGATTYDQCNAELPLLCKREVPSRT